MSKQFTRLGKPIYVYMYRAVGLHYTPRHHSHCRSYTRLPLQHSEVKLPSCWILIYWFIFLVSSTGHTLSVCFSFFSGCQLGPRNESKNIQCQVNLGLKDTDLHNKHYVVYNNSQWTMCRLSRLVCLFENIFFYTLETPLQCVLYFSFRLMMSITVALATKEWNIKRFVQVLLNWRKCS